MNKLDEVDENDDLGRTRLEILKYETFFSEMDLRAIFNEYKEFKDKRVRGNYVRTAAYRLKRKFEKIIRSLRLFHETRDIPFNDRDLPVKNVYEDMVGMQLALQALGGAEEHKELSIEELIAKTIYWQLLVFERMEREQILSSELQSKWTEQFVEALTTDQLEELIYSYVIMLEEKAKKENKELCLAWSPSRPPYFYVEPEMDETKEELKETKEEPIE